MRVRCSTSAHLVLERLDALAVDALARVEALLALRVALLQTLHLHLCTKNFLLDYWFSKLSSSTSDGYNTEFVALSGRELHNALRVLPLDVVQVLLQLLQLPMQVLHTQRSILIINYC